MLWLISQWIHANRCTYVMRCIQVAVGHYCGGRPLNADQLAWLELNGHSREHCACKGRTTWISVPFRTRTFVRALVINRSIFDRCPSNIVPKQAGRTLDFIAEWNINYELVVSIGIGHHRIACYLQLIQLVLVATIYSCATNLCLLIVWHALSIAHRQCTNYIAFEVNWIFGV